MTISVEPGRNWAGNLSYSASRLVEPESWDELSEVITSSDRVRALGSRHCFNDIADTAGTLVSLARLAATDGIRIDESERTVTVPAGARYGDVAPELDRAGWAFKNLASLPHISIAGAVQTGTHGSGDACRSLAAHVTALDMLDASGDRVRLTRGDADFAGAVVGLGSLGVATHVTVEIEPRFEVAQTVFVGASWDRVLERFDAVSSAAASVSLFTTWRDPDTVEQVWIKARDGQSRLDADAIGARPASGPMHPLPGADPAPATEQGGVPGPWYERLPHFRLGFTPSAGDELQSEYLLPRTDAAAAIEAVRSLSARIAPVLYVSEVRTIAADDLWLSPSSGADTVGLHFTWKRDPAAVLAVLPHLEGALPASARPHWGKLFTLDAAELRARYPRWEEFRDLRRRMDPTGRFANGYVERYGL